MSVDINALLGSKPGVSGGRLCAAGTGLSVFQIVCCHLNGDSVEMIVENYPQLTLAQAYAALAYYYANREEVDAGLKAQDDEGERLFREHEASRTASK